MGSLICERTFTEQPKYCHRRYAIAGDMGKGSGRWVLSGLRNEWVVVGRWAVNVRWARHPEGKQRMESGGGEEGGRKSDGGPTKGAIDGVDFTTESNGYEDAGRRAVTCFPHYHCGSITGRPRIAFNREASPGRSMWILVIHRFFQVGCQALAVRNELLGQKPAQLLPWRRCSELRRRNHRESLSSLFILLLWNRLIAGGNRTSFMHPPCHSLGGGDRVES